jgi:hypothetical protein
MEETVGTLDLKIARLEQQLKIIRHQQILSSVYRDYKLRLIEKDSELQAKLDQLINYREQLLQQSGEIAAGRLFDANSGEISESHRRGQPVWPTA